ncbi:secreted protein [Rhodopirellula maiorica SM1]|uniref:Secreted protein n=1 Tax=Rhodopirellula maiorica SM1 TaxID=1265738 RepID=M5S454_9BACT|nr:hypothetical protein [Rhodopirellula maiorica]EMI20969.1 secreted protein [Rhodopirellula maiorica SM1]
MLKSIFWLGVVFCSLTIITVGSRVVADDDQAAPDPSTRHLPPGELGRLIELGRELVENTKDHPLS